MHGTSSHIERSTPDGEAESRAKHSTALTTLGSIAREINARIDQAAKSEQDADDHRLAAALQLAKAEKVCKKSGIGFKAWCDNNVDQSYQVARKLLAIGKNKNPREALEESRASGARHSKASREKTKAAKPAAPAMRYHVAKGNETPAYERAANNIVALDEHDRVRMPQHLPYRRSCNAKPTRHLPLAQSLNMTGQSNTQIKLHGVHLPPSIPKGSKVTGGKILPRPQLGTSRRFRGPICHRRSESVYLP